MLLRSNGIKTVVIGGCTTEGCVESTARDAMFNDYYVVIAEDAVGSDDRAQHDASMLLMRHRFDMALGERSELYGGPITVSAREAAQMRRLESRIAVVTGAASGIGKGIAIAFAREGASVVVADQCRRESRGRGSRRHSRTRRRGAVLQTDVSDPQSVQLMADAALARFGRVDILVEQCRIFTESPSRTCPLMTGTASSA